MQQIIPVLSHGLSGEIMRSLIILEVEHDYDDDFDTALSLISEGLGGSEFILMDSIVRLNVPECFRLDN